MLPIQFFNEFTAKILLSTITTAADEYRKRNSIKESNSTKSRTTTKKSKNESSDEDDDFSFFPEAPDDSDDESDDEEDEEDEYEKDEMVSHLMNFVSLMNVLDEGIESAYNQDPSAKEVYDKFDIYYAVIIPYLELVNISYQKLFPSELKPNLDKLIALVTKFTDEFIGDIYDDTSVGIGLQLKNELDEIIRLANIRIEAGSGRPSFETIMNSKTSEVSDETQTD